MFKNTTNSVQITDEQFKGLSVAEQQLYELVYTGDMDVDTKAEEQEQVMREDAAAMEAMTAQIDELKKKLQDKFICYKADAGELQGPGGKTLIVNTGKRSTTAAEIEEHIDGFLNANADSPALKKLDGKLKVYTYLITTGKDVTVGKYTFSCKKRKK